MQAFYDRCLAYKDPARRDRLMAEIPRWLAGLDTLIRHRCKSDFDPALDRPWSEFNPTVTESEVAEVLPGVFTRWFVGSDKEVMQQAFAEVLDAKWMAMHAGRRGAEHCHFWPVLKRDLVDAERSLPPLSGVQVVLA